jgi:hypothetical protein
MMAKFCGVLFRIMKLLDLAPRKLEKCVLICFVFLKLSVLVLTLYSFLLY